MIGSQLNTGLGLQREDEEEEKNNIKMKCKIIAAIVNDILDDVKRKKKRFEMNKHTYTNKPVMKKESFR